MAWAYINLRKYGVQQDSQRAEDRNKSEECVCLHRRMALKSLALWLLLVGVVLPLGRCQHWSYGLNPGGKRDLDSPSDTLDNLVERFLHVETPCGVSGCAEDSPYAKIYREKGFLGSVTNRENGHRTYKK